MKEEIRQRLDRFLKERNIDMKEASTGAGLGDTYVRDVIIRGRGKVDLVEKVVRAIDPSAVEEVLRGRVTEPAESGHYRPPPTLLGKRDLNVFSSVEGGPGEMMVFSTDPHEIVPRPWYVERDPEAFGVYLAGESMEPVYEAGQIIIVSPRSPLVKGKDAIFTAEPVGGDFRASLKRYRGQTEAAWLAKQFNPESDLKFERSVWKAWRVLGRFDG